jgi:tetratricopeptide (TPR) repeat protein
MNKTKTAIKTLITEEHSSQLHVWHQLGWKNVTLIYFDAHLDFQHISDSRIEKLKQCHTTAEIAQLEKPHHMVPDKGYSYSIEDFLFAAHRLGIIKHVIWVIPTSNEQPQNPMNSIRMLQNRDGFGLKDFTSFEIVGNTVTATPLGLKLTICGYQDLQNLKLPENTFIDIDIDYFIALPQDRPWIDPKVIFDCLKSLTIDSDIVTFTRSVSSGYMPLRYRFIADYLAALWREDIPEIEHYSRLYTLDQQAQNNEVEAAKAGCFEELEKMPNCAATYYLLSLCETEPQKATEYEGQAVKICPSYRSSVLCSSNAIISRNLKYNKTTLKRLEEELLEAHLDANENQLSHYTLGILYSMLGEKEQSLKHYHCCQKIQSGNYPELSFALGALFSKNQEYDSGIRFLTQALNDESTKAKSHTMLGKIYLETGNYQLAHEHLILATQMLPTSKKAAKLLADLYHKMGDDTQHQLQLNKYYQMKMLIP